MRVVSKKFTFDVLMRWWFCTGHRCSAPQPPLRAQGGAEGEARQDLQGMSYLLSISIRVYAECFVDVVSANVLGPETVVSRRW